MDIRTIQGVLEAYNENVYNNQSINSTINALNLQKTAQGQNTVGFANYLNQQLVALRAMFDKHNFFDATQLGILKSSGLDKMYGKNAIELIDEVINQVKQRPTNSSQLWTTFYNEYNTLKNQTGALINVLKPFIPAEDKIPSDYGVIEINFTRKTELVDFFKTKEQLTNWFYIIEGYSRLEGISREEYRIISISTNSPTKLTVMVVLTAITSIISVTADLIEIEEKFLKDRNTIENIRQSPLTDGELHEKFIKDAEATLLKKVAEKVNEIVSKRVREKNIENGNGDISNALTKSVQVEHDFIVNGGEVNFYLGDNSSPENTKLLESYNANIQKIKEIRDSIEKMKFIENSKDTNITTSNIQ